MRGGGGTSQLVEEHDGSMVDVAMELQGANSKGGVVRGRGRENPTRTRKEGQIEHVVEACARNVDDDGKSSGRYINGSPGSGHGWDLQRCWPVLAGRYVGPFQGSHAQSARGRMVYGDLCYLDPHRQRLPVWPPSSL